MNCGTQNQQKAENNGAISILRHHLANKKA